MIPLPDFDPDEVLVLAAVEEEDRTGVVLWGLQFMWLELVFPAMDISEDIEDSVRCVFIGPRIL